MGDKTKIGWCDHTMNFWWGCNKVSQECHYCYIDGIMKRAGRVPFGGPMRTVNWSNPDKWNRAAKKAGERRRVFTCSMSDFFHPGADHWRDEAWSIIKECEHLDWLVLTKRPELIADRLPHDWEQGYENVWLGVTAGCTDSFHRLDLLENIPARIKFLSAEPLLERLDLRPYLGSLDWVITGCERAHKSNRRLMDIDWVRDVDQQCQDADVAHYYKQAYIDNKGVPCEKPLLDGKVQRVWPKARGNQA